MRQSIILCSPLLATLAIASHADAATTYYVSPTGTATADCTTRENACDLASGQTLAEAGDTVILMDGVYNTALNNMNSGTSSAWITFQADTCSTPILEGPGDPESQAGGAGSSTAEYLRFIGIVSRGWNTGFGNGWTGNIANDSNGHFEYQYCIGDANGRTGFTFFSAEGIHIQNCISAHNGSSQPHSWSSGITLYSASGTNIVEGTVSFENMDAERNTDGSGFIVDESSNNATLRNNLAFNNGGSCFRLTKSSGTKFINNTCYHNGQNPSATGPTNPGEIYFTNDGSTTSGVSIMNNIFVAMGSPNADKVPVYNKPSSGWSNNVDVVNTSGASYFNNADGTNPDFTLSSAASSTLVGKGASGNGVPSNDIGFNPKCITKRTPTKYGTLTNASWWKYSIDYDYIKSIGGVAKCFIPKNRSGTPDIGAYANGAVSTSTAACPVPTVGGAPGTGGASSTGGTTSTGGSSNASNTGGANATTGGTSSANSTVGTGGASVTTGGTSGTTTSTGGTSSNVGGNSNVGGTSNSNAGSSATGGSVASNTGGSSVTGTGTATGGSAGNTGGSSASSTPEVGGSSSSNTMMTGNGGSTSSSSTVGGASAGNGTGSAVGGGNATNTGTTTNGTGTGNGAYTPGNSINDDGGCGCRVAGQPSRTGSLAAFGALGLALLGIRRRRYSR